MREKNIVLTGYTGDNGSASKDLIIVKLDGNGKLLDDVIIRDTNLNYGLYGLDIEQTTEEREYIVVGTGVQAATEAAPKYAFVLKVNPLSYFLTAFFGVQDLTKLAP